MQQPPILLEDGWSQIHQHGLKKLFHIIETGSLQEQGTATSLRGGAHNGSAASSSSSSADPRSHSPLAQGFTNEEYAKLYTSVKARTQTTGSEWSAADVHSNRVVSHSNLHCSALHRIVLVRRCR